VRFRDKNGPPLYPIFKPANLPVFFAVARNIGAKAINESFWTPKRIFFIPIVTFLGACFNGSLLLFVVNLIRSYQDSQRSPLPCHQEAPRSWASSIWLNVRGGNIPQSFLGDSIGRTRKKAGECREWEIERAVPTQLNREWTQTKNLPGLNPRHTHIERLVKVRNEAAPRGMEQAVLEGGAVD
jgi:hypothetical protein